MAACIALVVPATVSAQEKRFSFVVSPSSVANGAVPGGGMSVRFKNETPNGNSTINSVTATLPAGFTLTALPTTTYPGTLTWTPTSFTIKDMSPLKPGKEFYVTLPGVTVDSTTCGAASWRPMAMTGSQLNGETFARRSPTGTPTGYSETTNVTGTLSLAFDATSLPTSFVEDTSFTVLVFQQSSCGGTLPSVTVTLSASGASFTGSSATGTGTISLSGTFNDVGNQVTLTASATGYQPATTAAFTVFAKGNLDCTDDPLTLLDETKFSASPTGVTSIAQTAYAEGFRGLNVVKPGGVDCEPVNYEFTNNVLGDGPGTNGEKTDAKGQFVPANGISFVWDQSFQPNAAYSYTVTWQPEWFGLGSPYNRKTKFCNGAAPNVCSSTVDAQACLSPALLDSSLPGYPSNPAPACISAEVWAVVDDSECASLGAAPTDRPSCVRFSTTITDIFDPVFIR
jgi:hypothetical protein